MQLPAADVQGSISFAGDGVDLGYFNARVRGLRGRLLDAEVYASLMKAGSAQDLVSRLKATPYGPYIERAEARFEGPGRVVAEAAKGSLSNTFELLWRSSPPEAHVLLKALFSYWEVFDLKAVLRGVARGVKRDDVAETLLPVGEFPSGVLNTLLGSRTVEDVLAFLKIWGSPYAEPLEAAMPRYALHKNVIELELELDIFLYGFILEVLKKAGRRSLVLKQAVSRRIDARNVMTLLKISGEGFSREGASSVFTEGGASLTRGLFLELAALKTREEVLEGLSAEIRDPFIRDVLRSYDAEDSMLIEEAFDEAVEAFLYRAAISDPLSIALGASYVFRVVREVKNLRVIARGRLFEIPPEELSRYLFFRH